MANVRRTSLNLDLELVAQARAELGTPTTTETVHAALDAVVRRAALERLLAFDLSHLDNDEIEADDHAALV